MQDLGKIIEGCKKMQRKPQKALYDMYSPILYGMAMRYASRSSEAEDMLQEAFINIFQNIRQYKGTGSFEGWMKRILINAAIGYIRKHKKQQFDNFDDVREINMKNFEFSDAEFTKEEMLAAINSLPKGFRLIFNLYAIEGYKHREIADMLGIHIGTSKSQYSRARNMLKTKLIQLEQESKVKVKE
ncbi:MAG: RNA polymerase sigma factor [Bacteroidales bacterium]